MTQPLHVKYRPHTFKEVVGQSAVVTSMSKLIARKGSHSFLLSGPSGVGKTTLARIAAHEVGCEDKDLMEIDAATHTGVDAMRQIQETLRYRPFGNTKARAIIVDEAHGLSRQAWEALLKVVEEPPEHIYWFFCTTQLGKVPATIKTRCTSYALKSVADRDLGVLLDDVIASEKIKISDSIADLVIKEALGSPRQLLVNLALCQDLTDHKKAAEVLRSALTSDPVLELCRYLVKGGSWAKAMNLVGKLSEENPESVRIVICNYLATVLKGTNSDQPARNLLHILEAFSMPYNASENAAPLLLSVGRALLAGE